jgi:hypothetical protein
MCSEFPLNEQGMSAPHHDWLINAEAAFALPACLVLQKPTVLSMTWWEAKLCNGSYLVLSHSAVKFRVIGDNGSCGILGIPLVIRFVVAYDMEGIRRSF